MGGIKIMMSRFSLSIISFFLLVCPFTCSAGILDIETEDPPRGNWIQAYLLADGKTFVVHTPESIKIGSLSIDREFYMDSDFFEDIELKGPIDLKTDVTKRDFTSALINCGLLKPSSFYLSML